MLAVRATNPDYILTLPIKNRRPLISLSLEVIDLGSQVY
jgi:hypothetical protein